MSWSPASIEQKIPALVQRIEDGIADLKRLGQAAAETEWGFKYVEAVALVVVVHENAGQRTNAETREAAARLHTFTQHEVGDRCPQWVGATVIDAGLARSIAANAYDDARKTLYAVQAELGIAQTLLVSARAVQDSGR